MASMLTLMAAGLASESQRTLLVDLHSNARVSKAFIENGRHFLPGIAEVLTRQIPIQEAIRSVEGTRLDLLVGGPCMEGVEPVLRTIEDGAWQLKQRLDEVRKNYDLILIDCPCFLSQAAVNAFFASDAFMFAFAPSPLSMSQMHKMYSAIQNVRFNVGKVAPLLGILLPLLEPKEEETQVLAQKVRQSFGGKLLRTKVHVPVPREPDHPAKKSQLLLGDSDYDRAVYEQINELEVEVKERLERCQKILGRRARYDL